jgi:uncharacterized protein with von Willebrand factor type A (vWA) domain
VAQHGWVQAVVAALRVHGVTVVTGQAVACARALSDPHVRTADPWTRVAVGRLTLVNDPASLRVYDAIVPTLLQVLGPDRAEQQQSEPQHDGQGIDAAVDVPADVLDQPLADVPGEVLVAGRRAMDVERLRHRRFDRATDDERAAIDRAVRSLRIATPRRRGRRRRPGSRGELDLARSLERALRGSGELLDPALRERRRRPRPLVLVLDVSGSMAPVARTMLALAVAARRSGRGPDRRRVEVFAFGTRLTRLTSALDRRDPDAALAEAAARVVDWDGGTRIGASLDALVRTWGPRGVLRGAVVVVCSDGLERGDPHALGVAARSLRRRCHRLVWVSPLAGDPRFEPRQRGLAAALDSIDVLLPGHDLASIEELAAVVARTTAQGSPPPRRRDVPAQAP